MTLRNRIRFYQQLAVLVRSGVSMRASLQRLDKKGSGPEVTILARQIEEGQTLGEAFTAARFSPFECHLVAAGERSAQLELIFERLAQYWTHELHLSQELTRSLYYPIVLLHLAIITGALVELPHGTPAVLHTLIFGFALLYVAGFAIYTLIRVSWQSEVAKRFWLFVPLVGGALKSACAYRWITALRLEFVAGVPFPDAVADAWLASGYIGATAHAQEGERGMRSGEDLSSLVKGWRQLPRDWIDFVETGEISGEYETMFNNMETEAANHFRIARERMAEWVPKIFSFVLLLVVATMIAAEMREQTVGQIEEVEKAINGQ